MTGHGGRREGAGRKPRPYPAQILKIRATRDELEAIHALDTRDRALILLERSSREMRIVVEFSSDSLFGDVDPVAEGYDEDASTARFADMLETWLAAEYPGANVAVEVGINNWIRVDGLADHDEVPAIEDIIDKIYRGQDWEIEVEPI